MLKKQESRHGHHTIHKNWKWTIDWNVKWKNYKLLDENIRETINGPWIRLWLKTQH